MTNPAIHTEPKWARRARWRMESLGWIVVLVGFLSLAGVEQVKAQDTTNGQVWLDYHSHYYQNDQREWYMDGGLRSVTSDVDWGQAYLRPSIRFHRRKWFDIHAGLGAFYTANDGLANILELRPWQGLKFRWPIFDRTAFSHYLRLEERFSFSSGESDTALRLRYKLSTRIPLMKAGYFEVLDPFFLPISVELFSDVGPNIDPLFGSRGRFDIGLGYARNDSWVWELHFIVQASRSGLQEELETSDYILRLQLKHLRAAKDYRQQRSDLPD